MKIIIWNVNGLLRILKTDNIKLLLDNYSPNILCLSETKLSKDNSEIDNLFKSTYKYRYWNNSIERKGYSGTCILSKKKPLSIIYGLNELDNEGRVITLEFNNFFLVHVYTPNSGQSLARLEWRINNWDREFEKYIINLQINKPVLVCGDLNVAHEEIDIKNAKSNRRTAGFTIEERTSFTSLINNCNLIDIFRYKYPIKKEYTFWSYMRNSREKDIGWRLDYFLLNNILKDKIKDIKILKNIYGSDHAPVELQLKLL
jgi:exodeoxyribonuclease III